MKKIFFISIAVCFHALNGFAAEIMSKKKVEATTPKKPEILVLSTIDAEQDQNLSLVTARFNQNFNAQNLEIEDHGTFLQVKFPQTIVSNSGAFFEGNSPYVKKIAAFQVDEVTGALRLFVTKEASKLKLASKVDVLGDRVVVTVDHDKIAQLLTPQEIPSAVGTEVKVADAGSDKKMEVAAAPATDAKANQSLQAGVNVSQIKLREKAIIAAIFSAAMFVLLGLFFAFKRFFKSTGKSRENAIEPVEMKLLSSMLIAPKQKLSLIQIGGEQILIGVSSNSLNYITTINKKPQLAFTDHLLESKPAQTEIKMTPNPSVPKSIHSGKPPVAPAIEGKSEIKRKKPDDYEDLSKLIRERLRKLPTT